MMYVSLVLVYEPENMNKEMKGRDTVGRGRSS